MSTLENTRKELYLEFCLLTDPRYQKIRGDHYVENKGVHGQQIHFLINYKGKVVGIISGSSAAYATAPRDKFFGITKDNREKVLNGIINNIVFRIETKEYGLASRCVKLWRDTITPIWEDLYGAKVYGYETFIIPDRTKIAKGGVGETDKSVYKKTTNSGLYGFDGWSLVGETEGNTKTHSGEKSGGLTKPFERVSVVKKLVICRWRDGMNQPIESPKTSSWMAGKPWDENLGKRLNISREDWNVKREEFKSIAKILSEKRSTYLGKIFEESKMEKTCENCGSQYKKDRGYKHRDKLCVRKSEQPEGNTVQPNTVQPIISTPGIKEKYLGFINAEVNRRLAEHRLRIEAEVREELKNL